MKLNSGVASVIKSGLPQRHSSLVADAVEYENDKLSTQPEIMPAINDTRSMQARTKQNQTGTFRSGAQASAQ